MGAWIGVIWRQKIVIVFLEVYSDVKGSYPADNYGNLRCWKLRIYTWWSNGISIFKPTMHDHWTMTRQVDVYGRQTTFSIACLDIWLTQTTKKKKKKQKTNVHSIMKNSFFHFARKYKQTYFIIIMGMRLMFSMKWQQLTLSIIIIIIHSDSINCKKKNHG